MATTPPDSAPAHKKSLRFYVDAATTLAIWIALTSIVWVNWPKSPAPPLGLPPEPVALEPISLLGDPAAPVVLIVFSDYQCPYCRRFAREVESLVEERYVRTGKARLGYRHLPIERAHPLAKGAALAAECADRQGSFWQMHRRLFERSNELSASVFRGQARELDLNMGEFESCLSGETAAAKIAADAQIARAFRITGTPTLLLGEVLADGRIRYLTALHGAVPIDTVATAIEQSLPRSWFSRHVLVMMVVVLGIGTPIPVAVWLRRRSLGA